MTTGESNIVRRLLYAIAGVIAMLFIYTNQAAAEYQQVSLEPDNTTQSVGSTFSIAVNYDVSNNNKKLSGIGVSIHFDSSKIEYITYQNSTMTSTMISDPICKDESSDDDRDRNTDKVVVLAWADLNNTGWPNKNLPLKLLDLRFKTKDSFTDGNTTLNISKVSTNVYYSFKAVGTTIQSLSSQEISLKEGWNLFSFSVNKVYYETASPPDIPLLTNAEPVKVESLSDVLESIDGDYDFLLNMEASGQRMYTSDPLLSMLNDLHYLAVGYGYWIRMNKAGTLRLTGQLANPTDSLALHKGWNLVGCWHTKVQYDSDEPPAIDFPNTVQDQDFNQVNSLSEVFSSIDNDYTFIIRFSDFFTTDPILMSLNSLHYVGPGYAYWIYTNQETILQYE
ncbi:MAG: hypothetical protein OMM_00775 [Candidatus Magnetoglobus multicellularis str. Araruama]|uniref:Cohesin domain-containing protein n=1 Tax=Candidatus Magnetoglobus multicellularis str. Araruama TaxID=890399 RepID=A0A1V1PFY4_9BACT|nr:MAG: hypothetical protein OMM_00775 [Candidatus Magnetoglobus multicellularis str. Araruama]